MPACSLFDGQILIFMPVSWCFSCSLYSSLRATAAVCIAVMQSQVSRVSLTHLSLNHSFCHLLKASANTKLTQKLSTHSGCKILHPLYKQKFSQQKRRPSLHSYFKSLFFHIASDIYTIIMDRANYGLEVGYLSVCQNYVWMLH